MKFKPVIVLILTLLLLAAGSLALAQNARAADNCTFGCSPSQKLFGRGPFGANTPKPGNDTFNDRYNQKLQQRYQSGTKAQPFDFGSPLDRNGPAAGKAVKSKSFNDDRPDARSEHVRWCLKRYRSYRIDTDTYVTNGGRTRYCDSPFDNPIN